jgi:hypothetical protein
VRYLRKLSLCSLLFASACGGDEDTTPPLQPTDVQQVWDIRAMTCNGAPLAPLAGEYYRLDASHVVRIEKTTDDATSVCRAGFVFDKAISSSGVVGSTYEEEATLVDAGMKTTCWAKQNGMEVEPPTSDTLGEFGPETRGFKMSTTPDTVTLEMGPGSRCSEGTLVVELGLRTS